MPPFKAVLAFEATARHASFTRAASELNVTQGAVSRQIHQLELFLGATLLDRTTRAVSLTLTGERYFEAVQHALRELGQATGHIKHWQGKQQVTIATSTALASLWLLPQIAKFNSRYEEIELRIVAHDHVKDYRNINCDLAIYYCKTPPLGMKVTPICSEEIFAVCSPSYLERHEGLKLPEDLAACTWLCLEDSEKDWVSWDDWFLKLGSRQIRPKQKININSYAMLIQAAIGGQGIALGWRNLVDPYIESGALVQPITATLQTEAKFCLLEKLGSTENRKYINRLRSWLLGNPVENF